MPRVYENIKMEYLAAKGTVAMMDRSHMGRLKVTGAKRFDLLHRLSTNDLRSIGAGQGARTVLLTDKGRIIEDLRLYALEDHYLLLTSPNNQTRVKETIEKLRFRDDVTLEDVTASTAMITLYGPQSAHLLEAAGRARLGDLPTHHNRRIGLGGAEVTAARTKDIGGGGFHLVAPAGAAPDVWNAILRAGEPYGLSVLGEEAWEMLRIEHGLPRWGRELTAEHNPLEARLDDAVDWKKGCYVGQEVVARLDSRQKLSQLLVGLWLEPGPVPDTGSPIEEPGKEGTTVGRLTSVAPSLDLRRVIGLAYVRTAQSTPGTRLSVVSDGDRIEAEVAQLPFSAPTPEG